MALRVPVSLISAVQDTPFYGIFKWMLTKAMPPGYDYDVRGPYHVMLAQQLTPRAGHACVIQHVDLVPHRR